MIFAALALAQAVTLFNLTAFANYGIDRVDPSIITPLIGTLVSDAQSTLLDHFPSFSDGSNDMKEWGDSIQSNPDDHHRIYFQNIDGLRNDADEMDLYISSMAQFKTGTFCWADHGLNLAQPPIQQKLKTPILAHFGTARSACSYSNLPPGPTSLRTGYQPGGIFMATTGKWVTRSTGKPIVDPSGLGRWSGLCFLGKRGKRLAVITA